jgi:hypothetical protein
MSTKKTSQARRFNTGKQDNHVTRRQSYQINQTTLATEENFADHN